jgi:hypothetical protein
MPKKMPLAEYLHKLPENSHYRKHWVPQMAVNSGESEVQSKEFLDLLSSAEEISYKMREAVYNALQSPVVEDIYMVLVYDGDLTLDSLHLDFGEQSDTALIVVEGNCRIEKALYNYDTDGAPSLMVFGDLHVGNVAVGGQEIYVQGDLHVTGLLWGHYNHGELIVKGDCTADLIIATDYAMTFSNEVNCRHRFDVPDEQDHYEFSDFLIAHFPPEVCYQVDGFEYLDRSELVKRWLAGEQSYTIREAAPPVPLDDVTVSMENLDKISGSVLLDPLSHQWVMVSEAHGFQITVTRDGFLAHRNGLGSVAVHREGGALVSRYTKKPERESSWTAFPDGPGTGRLSQWRARKFAEWLQQSFAAVLQAFHQLEPVWEEFDRVITVERVEELLSAERTRHIGYFGDNNALWIGNMGLSFLRADYMSEAGETYTPEFRIVRPHVDLEMEYFSFEIVEAEGQKAVRLLTRSDKYWSYGAVSISRSDPFDAATAKTAMRLFDRAHRLLQDKDVLDGIMSCDDE